MNARSTRSTASGQKCSKEESETAITKRQNARSSSRLSPWPLTEDDISSIVTAVVQALPGRAREIPNRAHLLRDSDY